MATPLPSSGGSLRRVAVVDARRGALGALAAASLAAALTPAPAAAGPTSAAVVRLPLPRYDGTLTPYTFDLGYPVVTLVYDTLTWRDAAGVPRPWLARSVTRAREGRSVTVRLRPNVRWHDGRPLTAADVAFTFRFVVRRYHPRFTPQLADVRRVRTAGALTVTFDLRRPSLGFEDQPLADLPILPRHLWRGLPSGRDAPPGPPVGSGPYRLAGASRTGGYVLSANRGYFRGAPRVREVRVPIVGDAERTFEALRRRRVDMVPLSLPVRAAEEIERTAGIAVRRGASYLGTTLLLNLRARPFADPEVRRAAAASLDLGRILRNVGPGVAATEGPIHPASAWSPGVTLQRTDVRAARLALARLGPSAIRVLAPNNDPARLEAGRQVVLALRRGGATATLVRLSPAELSRAVGEDGSPPDFDAAIRSIPALTSQDPAYLATLFGSPGPGAPLNMSGYRSAAFDALARRVAAAPDRAARLDAVRAELRLLARDLPSIPLFFSEGTFGFRSAIYDGWEFVKGTGILDKRSFLPGAKSAGRSEATAVEEVADDEGDDSGSSLGVVSTISLVVLGIVVLLAGYALAQRRRTWRP